jgi:hypothetical protein
VFRCYIVRQTHRFLCPKRPSCRDRVWAFDWKRMARIGHDTIIINSGPGLQIMQRAGSGRYLNKARAYFILHHAVSGSARDYPMLCVPRLLHRGACNIVGDLSADCSSPLHAVSIVGGSPDEATQVRNCGPKLKCNPGKSPPLHPAGTRCSS